MAVTHVKHITPPSRSWSECLPVDLKHVRVSQSIEFRHVIDLPAEVTVSDTPVKSVEAHRQGQQVMGSPASPLDAEICDDGADTASSK